MTQAANLAALAGSINSSGQLSLSTGTTGTLASVSLPAGTVVQIGYVSNSNYYETSSTTFQASDVSQSFTPLRANSKIILQCDVATNFTRENGGFKTRFYDATAGAQIGNIYNCHRFDINAITTDVYAYNRGAMLWRMDSWGTTSKTIRIDFALIEGTGTASINTGYPATQSTQFFIWEVAA